MQTLAEKANEIFKKHGNNGRDGVWSIIMTDGDGCYINSLPKAGVFKRGQWVAKSWDDTIRSWCQQGHRIDVVLSIPNEQGLQIWQWLQREYPDSIAIHELYKNAASGAQIDWITSLETYHPTLFFGPHGQRAMYVEQYHQRHSRTAQNVMWVSPKGIERGMETTRFERYERIFNTLLGRDPENPNPPYLKTHPHLLARSIEEAERYIPFRAHQYQ